MTANLGTCCICGVSERVNTIIMLDLRSPTPGHDTSKHPEAAS